MTTFELHTREHFGVESVTIKQGKELSIPIYDENNLKLHVKYKGARCIECNAVYLPTQLDKKDYYPEES